MQLSKEQKEKLDYQLIGNVSVDIEIITPQIAADYLEMNHENRALSQRHIDWLASQMKNGRWFLTHQGIAFDANGHLRDGQHRLYALIQAMKDLPFVVTRHLDPNTFQVMDTGKLRSAADVLFIEGFTKYSKNLAAVARFNLEWQSNHFSHVGKSSLKVTNYMILQYCQKHPEIQKIVARHATLVAYNKGVVNINIASSLAYIFSQARDSDLDTAMDFFEKLYTGADLGAHSPILYLRHWLMQEAVIQERYTKKLKVAMIVKGWNYWRNNTPINKMWRFDGKKESFPKPI
jgi:hypothetical protein